MSVTSGLRPAGCALTSLIMLLWKRKHQLDVEPWELNLPWRDTGRTAHPAELK